MNRDDVIRMAREAGFVDYELEDYTESGFDVRYERFAALVAAAESQNYEHTLALQQQSYEREIQIEVEAEREACVTACQSVIEEIREIADNVLSHEDCRSIQAAQDCINAIRARSNA